MKAYSTLLVAIVIIVLTSSCSSNRLGGLFRITASKDVDENELGTIRYKIGKPIKERDHAQELFGKTVPVETKNKPFEPARYQVGKDFRIPLKFGWGKDTRFLEKELSRQILKTEPAKQESNARSLLSTGTKTISLKKKEEFTFSYSSYLPGGNEFFTDTSLVSMILDNNILTASTKVTSSGISISHFPKVKSKHFEFDFYFPTDFSSFFSISLREEEVENELVKAKYDSYWLVMNTVLDLPMNIPIGHFKYSDRLKKDIAFLNLKPSSEFNKDSTFLTLSKNTLQLNPAFVESYDKSIEYLWQLYLFEINYNVLSDTLVCYDFVLEDIGSFQKLRKQLDRPKNWYPEYGYLRNPYIRCMPRLYTSEAEKYLNQAFHDDLTLYTSYFELILWQIFQPTNFKIADANGSKRKLIFTSRDYRHEGEYEVKFDLLRPYKFKVSKL